MVNADRARSRTFVVTGAASGIGLATARRLLDEGGTVVGTDIAAPPDDLGDRFAFVTAEVSDEAAVASALRRADDSNEGGARLGDIARRQVVAVGQVVRPQVDDREIERSVRAAARQ